MKASSTASLLLVNLLAFATRQSTAFVVPRVSSSTLTRQHLVSPETSSWIATVDADIAKMSDNEFFPVFMGGIAVMFGGLLSAVFVGTVVDRKDLSAQMVAEAYAQIEEDADFWKNLSEEETRKARAVLDRIKQDQEGGVTTTSLPMEAAQIVDSPVAPEKKAEPVLAGSGGKQADMFDDYGS